MSDRDKVIRDVETAFEIWIDEFTGCSWFKKDKAIQARDDAITMLKEDKKDIDNLCKSLADSTNMVHELLIEQRKLLYRQKVVLCKNCIHYRKDGYCRYNNHVQMNPDWYCADGERETDA